MAKKKTTQIKGFTAEYWVITQILWNKQENKTHADVMCFKDQATRELGLENYIGELNKQYIVDGNKTIGEIYEDMAISRMSEEEEPVETNFFADAVDA